MSEFPNVNNKLAFFDFDRTLVAHTYSQEYTKACNDSYFMECAYNLTSLEQEHATDKPLPCMQWYTKKLFDDGYGLYVLTHEVFNLRDQLKKDQLKLFYPKTPMTYLTVDTPEHKVDMMMAVAMAECCDLSDVIFVDDMLSTVKLALAAGIDAKHLSDIVVMYETQNVIRQQNSEIKPKGFAGYVTDDPSLMEEITYDQIAGAGTGFSDEKMEEAFNEADRVFEECRILAEMNNRNNMDGGTRL